MKLYLLVPICFAIWFPAAAIVILQEGEASRARTLCLKSISQTNEALAVAERWKSLAVENGEQRDRAISLAVEALRQRDEARRQQCGERL